MKLVINPACSWPEFCFVAAWKPNKQVMRLKMGGNFTRVKQQ